MFGMTMGILVETGVAILLALTLGYCVILNRRLKRLHDDRDSLKLMVADLINATNLANAAIKELKATAVEADSVLAARLEEAERFGIQLANHVSAGTSLMERIAKITSAARHSVSLDPAPAPDEPSRVQSALQQLASRPRMRGQAA